MFRLLLFAGCGFVAGVVVALWLLMGNRLAWGTTPAYIRENFEKEGGEPQFVRLLVGDANTRRMTENNESFIRLVVNSAGDEQLALSQIDDYTNRPHGGYAWQPPLRAEARLRLSGAHQPGTAGFFLWNNPMPLWAEAADFRPINWIGFMHLPDGASVNLGGIDPRFRASVMASTWPEALGLASGTSWLPKPRVDEASLDDNFDPTAWHTYTIEYLTHDITLLIDGKVVLESAIKIGPKLALVLWVDNNKPVVTPEKFKVDYDKMSNVWMDIDYVEITRLD